MPSSPAALPLVVLSRPLPIKPNQIRMAIVHDQYHLLSSALMYPKNDDHDLYLYHCWNSSDRNTKYNTSSTTKPTTATHITTPTYQTAYAPIKVAVKDDPSVTPTLETLCTLDTLDTCFLHSTNVANDTILSITNLESTNTTVPNTAQTQHP